MRATIPPPAPTPERVPHASSRVRTISDPCWAWSPLRSRKRTSMLVAWCHCSEVNRYPPLYNSTSVLVKKCTGCTTPVGEAKIPSDLGTKK